MGGGVGQGGTVADIIHRHSTQTKGGCLGQLFDLSGPRPPFSF